MRDLQIEKGNLLRKLIQNKVLFYVFSRYAVSGISFLTSLLLAVKLSPYFLGIWGSIMLIRRYYQLINLGIPDSASVLIVQKFDDKAKTETIESTSIFLSFILSLIAVAIFLVLFVSDFSFIDKYNLGEKWFYICAVVVFTYFNDLFFKVYRTKGKVAELTFYQSIAQLLCFVAIFTARDARLVWFLLFCYVVGYLLAFIVFIRGKSVYFSFRKISFNVSKQVLAKGFFLFVYNTAFYLIMLSTRSFISSFNSVENFGLFTFSFTLANGVLVLLDALSSLFMPKLIDKFMTGEQKSHMETLYIIKYNYVFLSFFISLIIIAVLPLALKFFPAYYSTFSTICYLILTSSVFSCCFGLTSYLMANNYERIMAVISIASLIVNIALTYFVARSFPNSIEYPCIVVLFCYLLFFVLCFLLFKKKSGYDVKVSEVCFSLDIVIPAILALIVSYFKLYHFSFVPLVVFFAMGYKNVRVLYSSFVKLLNRPNIIDINHNNK